MKSFFNKNGGYIAAFAFVIAAGVFAGVTAVNKKSPEKNIRKEEVKIEEPVLKNKNKPKKPQMPKKNVQPQKAVQPKPNIPQTEKNNSEDFSMIWPADGEIIMEYSPSAMIFDPTLEQYRTNDSVCIAAAVGSNVKASADGVAKEVVSDENGGNYVVVEHKNGWETLYGELDGIKVSKGDRVEKGQVIGVVGEPSVYSCELGDHIEFKVTLDDMSVNPSEAVAKTNGNK